MNIDKADPRLTAYVFGELSDEEKKELEAELTSDDESREQLAEIQRTLGAIRSEFAETKPRQLDAERRQKIEQAVRDARSKKRRQLLWGVASVGSVAAVVLLLATTLSTKPEVRYMNRSAASNAAPRSTATETAEQRVVKPALKRATPPIEALREAPPPLEEPYAPLRLPGLTSDGASETKPRAVAKPRLSPEPIRAQDSNVNAGEWDDNANYREFQRWLSGVPAREAHRIDVRDRRFIVVRDSAGRGVPGCRVIVADESDRQTELVTSAAGRAILFPHAEGLTGQAVTVTTECAGGGSVRSSVPGQDGIIDLRTSERRALPAEHVIDVAFILDSTGSMSEEIAAVKSTIQKVASNLRDQRVRIRVGLVEYKDREDDFVTRIFPMTTNLGQFSTQVANVNASGGGDKPESVNEALHVGINQLAWSDAALAKLAFLIGDAPPHLDYSQDYDYALEARTAAHRGIQVYTVAASGMDILGQVVWRQVAQYTGATNLFVLRGGAGPQSVGAGDPKSSCGGTQTAYTSGNLDALVLAKIKGAIRALDRDPMRIAGLDTDENAKPCAERIVIAQ
ncbi:MAG TPA: VWA domain-containing protein [Polyangiaceae bacterium]|nr:VWA domain-containing protein [Polyangiaceae bacterium]